jgi:tripartite-type tricarboxylate transporter receptor subunit TctC
MHSIPLIRRRAFNAALLSSTLLAHAKAGAQSAQPYPVRPVRLIVPYGVGTVSDFTARLLAEKLAVAWGQGVVVDNLTGAGGVVGTQTIARSTPDGYTLGMLASNHAMNAAIYSHLPYDPVKDFTPVLHVSFNQFAFCVNASVPATTLKEFIALAKAKPNQINYGSSGNGGSPHLAVARMAYMAGIQIVHIPYRSNGAAVTAILSGDVALMATSISALLPHIKTGKLRALAVSGDQRSPLLPDVPTVAEAGVPGYSMKNWNGIVAPAGLPAPIVSKLQADIKAVLQEKSVQDQFSAQGVELEILDSEAFGRRLRDEIAVWSEVVKATGAKID